MKPREESAPRPLSPISRRIFLLAAPSAGAAFLAACGSGDGDDYADCLYCDDPGQDYEECDADSDYCDYINYNDGS